MTVGKFSVFVIINLVTFAYFAQNFARITHGNDVCENVFLLCFSRTIEQKYVEPVLTSEHINYYRLTPENLWEADILSSIQDVYDACGDKVFELKVQRAFCNIWINLCENILLLESDNSCKNHHLSSLKNMISYINLNYREKITLQDVASAGKVGKTTCCYIFKKYVNKTPNLFLTDLRLRKGVELLNDTDMTVLEISYEVGFSGASYFTETFRNYYGYTPSEYRKISKYGK